MSASPEPLTIGIVGGTSPQSTIEYYRRIVQLHIRERGDHSYPRIVIASVSFQKYINWQHAGDWTKVAAGLQSEMVSLAAAGADFGLLAANTMHKVLPMMDPPIPVLSVLDAVAEECEKLCLRSLGLTGTKFTMEDGYYSEALEARGLKVIIPAEDDRKALHRIIFNELVSGTVNPQSVEEFKGISARLADRGADAVLLACTELELLVQGGGLTLPLIDTAQVHADAAWRRAVSTLGPRH